MSCTTRMSSGLEMLEQFGDVVQAYGMSQEELCAKISSCDALIVRSGTKARCLCVDNAMIHTSTTFAGVPRRV